MPIRPLPAPSSKPASPPAPAPPKSAEKPPLPSGKGTHVDGRGKSLHRRSAQLKREELWSAAGLIASVSSPSSDASSSNNGNAVINNNNDTNNHSSSSSSSSGLSSSESESDTSSSSSPSVSPYSTPRTAATAGEPGTAARAPPAQMTATEEYMRSARRIIDQILDLDPVRLDSKMAAFLNSDGVLEVFLSYITRMPNGPRSAPVTLDASWAWDQRIRRQRDRDYTATMQSYRVMDILCATNPVNGQLAERRLKDIVRILFDSLALNSDANLYHFAEVLHSFLRRNAPVLHVIQELLATPASWDGMQVGDSMEPPFLRLLRYLHVPPVSSLVITCLMHGKHGLADRTERYARLQEAQFIECLLRNITYPFPELVEATVDLFSPLVDDVLRLDGSGALFMSLATDKQVLQSVFDCLDSPLTYQREAVISIFHALIVRSVPKPLSSTATSTPATHSVAFTLSQALSTNLLPYLGAIAASLPTLQRSSLKLQALELITAIAAEGQMDELETALPAAFWRHVTDLVLVEFPTAPFLAPYFRLLRTALDHDQSTALVRGAIVKPRLVQRLISYYENGDASFPATTAARAVPPGMGRKRSMQLAKLNIAWGTIRGVGGLWGNAAASAPSSPVTRSAPVSPPDSPRALATPRPTPSRIAQSDLHAFTLLLLNLVRLHADMRPGGDYLVDVLHCMPEYNRFLSTLRSQTEALVKASRRPSLFSSSLRLPKWPAPQIAPDPVRVDFIERDATPPPSPSVGYAVARGAIPLPPPPPKSPSSFSALQFAAPPVTSVALTTAQELSIDLGSKYAVCLGFDPRLRPALPVNRAARAAAAGTTLASVNERSAAAAAATPADGAVLVAASPAAGGGSLAKRRRVRRRKSRAQLFAELTPDVVVRRREDGASESTKATRSPTAPPTPTHPAVVQMRLRARPDHPSAHEYGAHPLQSPALLPPSEDEEVDLDHNDGSDTDPLDDEASAITDELLAEFKMRLRPVAASEGDHDDAEVGKAAAAKQALMDSNRASREAGKRGDRMAAIDDDGGF
ncbi:hypothetical protein BC828DRAFT_373480 [Blastocladiella britannica]|nr:hypothetical protein BC828DRAFT_373480 [Blastocladiella britannica]